jgi:hypothetical protein
MADDFPKFPLGIGEVAHLKPISLKWDVQKPAVVIRAAGDWTPQHTSCPFWSPLDLLRC